MPAHAQLVTAVGAGNGGGTSAGGALQAPTPRLRAIPSTGPGVADVPRTLEGQKRFYELHDRILRLGARSVGTADDMEEDLNRTLRLRELQANEQSTNTHGTGYDSNGLSATHGDEQAPLPPSRSTSQASSTSRNSELEVERYLLTNRFEKPETSLENGRFDLELYGLDEKEFVDLPEGDGDIQKPDLRPAEGGMAAREPSEVEDEGPPMEEDDEQVGDDRASTPQHAGDRGDVTPRAKRRPSARTSTPQQVGEASDSEPQAEQKEATSGPLEIVRLLDFWQENVSKINSPHIWYRQQPASTNLISSNSSLYGCKLTLVMPDGTKRTFETTVSYSNKLAACIDAFSQAWVSGVHSEAAQMREQIGWEAEEHELEEERERTKAMRGGEKPYEMLKAEQERWMALPIKITYEKDELNSVHGCTLSIATDAASTPRDFTSPVVFLSPREARAAAARLALEAEIPVAYERAFQDLLKRDQGGYIQFGDFSAADAAVLGDLQQDEEAPNSDEEETLDAEGSVRKEVRAAFGHAGRWMKWTYPHAEKVGETNAGPPILGATLTIDFPVTREYPDPPPAFTASTPLKYRTKRHARLACCSTAIADGLFDKLEPYKEERRMAEVRKEEEKKKREEQRQKDREAGINWETPPVGTVKYEELESLRNPAGYLNVCAQQWTGNGSPLKFEYTAETVENSNIKYYGCTLSIFVNISLSKSYVVPPSPELATHGAAKEAAVRLALREHVLDLLMPADFDPAAPILTAAAAARLARAARGMEALEQDAADSASGREGMGSSSDAAILVQPRDAVAELDAFVQEWVGQGCLPSYEVHCDPITGLWGGTVIIPFAQDLVREDGGDPNSPLVPCWSRKLSCRNASLTRRRAEQRLAQDALDEGIVDFMRSKVPQHSKNVPRSGTHGCGSATGDKRPHAAMEDSPAKEELRQVASADVTPERQAPRKKLKRDLADTGVELVGQEGGEVDRLRRGCRSILGLDLLTGPRYELHESDGQHDATVLVPLDAKGTESRRFICDEPHESADLAAEAAAKSALDAGILELVESRVRPKARPAPVATDEVKPCPEKDIRTAQKGIALPAAVPKHGEELAAIRRATYGGFGMATASQLEAITKKLEQELRDDKACEEARRAAEREVEERKRLGNPLLPGVPTTAEELFADQQTSAHGQQDPTSALSELQAYCDQRSIAFPEIHVEPSTETQSGGPPRVRVWLILLGLKYELRKAKASTARERLAAQVLGHLAKTRGSDN